MSTAAHEPFSNPLRVRLEYDHIPAGWPY